MIKSKPWWLRPFLPAWRWVTISPAIYASDDYWKSPGPQWMPLVAHEYVHLGSQENYGKWSWIWRYYTDPDFRLLEEARGIAVEIEETSDTERKLYLLNDYSQMLAGPEYRRCATSPAMARACIMQFLKGGIDG